MALMSASSSLMTSRLRPSSARIASSSVIVARSVVQLLLEVDARQARQLPEAHVEDVLGLLLAERRTARP